MATYIADPIVEQHVRAQRQATGADRYDEVWDGVYVVMPAPIQCEVRTGTIQ